MIPVIKKYPELLGLGLSEGTAIAVKGDRFEVMGAWKVAVHDNQKTYQPWEKPYFVLSRGDVYNMKSRRIERFGNGTAGTAYPTIVLEAHNRLPTRAPGDEFRPARDRLGQREAQDADEEKKAITTLLNDQVTAWNKGDLPGFMKGYWESDELTFFSGSCADIGLEGHAGALSEKVSE